MSTRICFYVACHHNALTFASLWKAIYSPTDLFIVHVDRKSPDDFAQRVADIVGTPANVILMPRRRMKWGGWSQVSTELAAMRIALKRGGWDYFINLSGQDLPTKPIAQLKASLGIANWIRAWSFERVRRNEPNDPHLKQRLPIPYAWRFKGSQWHMLTRRFCEWLTTSWAVRVMGWYFRFTHIPDETFISSAFVSYCGGESLNDCGRYLLWPGPKTITLADVPAALADPTTFFARKFDAEREPGAVTAVLKAIR